MKIGLISDTHFSNWKTFGQCHEGQISKRLLKQKENFEQAVSIFKKEKVDFVVFGGDWVHQVGTITNEVLYISSGLIQSLPHSLFVVGNHDTPVRTAPKEHHILTNTLHEFGINTPKEHSKVFLVNYTDEVDYDLVKGYDLVVLHKQPVGAKLGGYTFNEGVNWRKLAANNKFVAFGHIHQMQKLSENCFIIGSPMHLGFGDEGRRGIWIVDTEVNKCEFHKLDYPEFITVEKPEQVKDDGNYYKVLGSKSRMDNDNVISVVVPEMFKERIQSQDFTGIIREWLTINNKDETYLELVKDILEEKLSLVKDLYKGKLTKVTIKDFLSVGEVEYEVPENGFTLVAGDSDSFSSNGSGKSSIIGESICWALFGETTKGLTGDDVIRRGEKDCTVTLGLVPGLTITRSRKNGLEINSHLIGGVRNDLVDGMRQTDRQEYLEKSILGFDKKVFLASVYFSQENLLMLTKLSDSEKTNMITDLLGFEQYDELQDKVSKKITKFNEDILLREADKIRFEKEQAVKKSELTYLDNGIEDKDRQINDFNKLILDYKLKVKELSNQLTLNETIEKIDYDSQILELTNRQEVLANKIEVLRETKDSIQQEYNQLYGKVTSLKVEVDTIGSERQKIERDIEKLKSVKLDVRCDKCGSMVTEDNITLFIDEKNSKQAELDAELIVVEAELLAQEGQLNSRSDHLNQLLDKEKVFTREQSDNRPKLLSLTSLKSVQEEKEKELLVRNERTQGEINKYESFVKDYSDRLKVFEEEKEKLNNQKTNLSLDIKLIESNIDSINFIIKTSRRSIEVLEFWKIAFSPKGIRSVLLDKFCNEINVTVNGYLSTVSGGTMSIMVTPTKSLKSGEERNKIGMNILLEGQEVKYESLSGGEKRRVDLSLIFGLNRWVSEKYSVPSGILGLIILDECFSYLDVSGSEVVAQLLFEEGKDRSIFVIDHSLSLSSYATNIWTVIKQDGISTLRVS